MSTEAKPGEEATGSAIVSGLWKLMETEIEELTGNAPVLAEMEAFFRRLAHRCREVRSVFADLEPGGTEIPIRQIRKQLAKAMQVTEELHKLQDSIPLPSSSELDAMIAGKAPVSKEAYVTAVLQFSLLKLEAGAFCVREDLHSRRLNDPLFRSGWAPIDNYVLHLMEAVRAQREWRARSATSGTAVENE